MKKLYATIGLFLATLLSAQVPQAFSYQTIAFNASGTPIANGNVALKVSILDNSATGTVLYTETHNKTTNAKGLVNLNIGQGTATTGTFGGINWGTNTKFVKVEMDPQGGSNYTNVGVNQLMSVPYALVAEQVDYNNIKNNPNDINALSFMTNSNAYIFAPSSTGGTSSYSNSWYSTAISGTPFMRSYNSFLTSTNAYVFAPSSTGGTSSYSNDWYSTAISGSPFKIVTKGDYVTGVATTTNAYAFSPSSTGGTSSYSNNWYSTAISGTIKDIIITYSFIGVLTSTNAYVFGPSSTGGTSSYSNNWYSTTISGTPLKIVGKGNGIMVITSTNAYVFGPSSTGGTGSYSNTWSSTTISGTPFQ